MKRNEIILAICRCIDFKLLAGGGIIFALIWLAWFWQKLIDRAIDLPCFYRIFITILGRRQK